MRITFFIGGLYGGGAERVTCNLASFLAQRSHQVEILTISETEESYELDERVTIASLLPLKGRGKNKTWNICIRFLRFWKYLKTHECDAYVVMLPATTIMLLAFRGIAKAKIIAAERVDPAAYPTWKKRSLKYLAKRANGFVFQTEEAKAWYGKAVSSIKTKIIPNAINPIFIRPQYCGAKRKVIAGAGRLVAQKNFKLLISAFSLIANEFPDYDLIIYGEGEERHELESMVYNLELSDRVSLPGNIKNIAEEMERNALFVLASDYEGMPNALMEAMALGLPCISTDCPCGGPRFLIKDGFNGVLVPVGKVGEMAEAMKALLSDENKRIAMGKCAMAIRDDLSPEKIYQRWETMILDI